jgi:predicted amidohydrolase
MKLIAEKYRKLEPRIEYLSDEVVIAQAWKKTHEYMRTHNWYADTLALDISALGLERNAKAWARNFREKDIKPTPLELVPAAKSEPWKIDPKLGWIPSESAENRKNKPPIRPLAHITIQDQTLATAFMMCLADAVETAQGDCAVTDFSDAQKKHIYSYGNRLLCDWKDDAWFRWGNSETYRKFFTDYQNFLRRPVAIGQLVAQKQPGADNIYVINLDLSKFYDNIDRTILLARLKQLSEEHGHTDICPEFWDAAKHITSWEWDSDAVTVAEKLGLKLGAGLPQGLVASGFFANAYMTKFDKEVGQKIGQSITNLAGVLLHDYCRYVDDIRLVVSIDSIDFEKLSDSINKWITTQLHMYASSSLCLNTAKTKITSLSDLDNQGSISGRIALLQSELSGPADRDVLENATAVLEGLLTISPEELKTPSDVEHDTTLIRLVTFDNDIRADTLKRFAANRLESIMRSKRKLTAPSEHGGGRETKLADNESELLSKKLVRAWMQDPSLGLVLRKAIEIYPSPSMASSVFEAIFNRSGVSGNSTDSYTAAAMNYLLADLFRCCVDFNGFFQYVDYPKSANPKEVLNVAADFAQKIVEKLDAPKFIKRQALLLLATLQKTTIIQDSEESIQHTLHTILANRLPSPQRQTLALFEVASQIEGRVDSFASLLLQHIGRLDEEDQFHALEEFAKRGGSFWLSIWQHLQKNSAHNKMLQRLKWAAPIISTSPKLGKQRLSMVVASEMNGFEHEAALIKLALGLIIFAKESAELLPLTPSEIEIKPSEMPADWNELWRPEVKSIKCFSNSQKPTIDPRFSIPDWLSKTNPDNTVVYWIGTILRAAVVGGVDFTGNRWKASAVVNYKGLRTSWYKRRMGMMHSAEALVGEYSTVSQWLSELLMKCLQWPGFESTHLQHLDIANIDNIHNLQEVLIARLNKLDALYCHASQIPTLVTTVNRPKHITSRGFRIVTVQQLLPRTEEFSMADPMLNNPKSRADNRDHLSRVCNLTYRTLFAKLRADGDESNVGADLIVFPEVAVHPDDQDIIKRLADKTRSIVFAGLVFQDHKGKLVNVARWFIPDYRVSGRQWILRDQGKSNMTRIESELGISGYRPCQHIIEIVDANKNVFKLGGAICYDATDLKLASDLKGKTDLFIVCAHNKDVSTFDTMASALSYHMYQHVVVVNKGEFGGSTIQAPYREHFERLISHSHGSDQISINVADLNLAAFKEKHIDYKKVKTKPAGF